MAGRRGAPQSLNHYSYGLNDPVNNFDPLGLVPMSIDFTTCATPYILEFFDDGHTETITGVEVCNTYSMLVDFGWGNGGRDDPASKFPDVVKKALELLKNPDCANVVGQGYLPEGGELSAADVLTDIASNIVDPKDANGGAWPPSHFGNVNFNAIFSPPGWVVSATTTPARQADHT